MNGDVCAICLDGFSAEELCTQYPGCSHPYHLRCLLQYAQYDIRCPTCRQTPTGVQRRPPLTPDPPHPEIVQIEELNSLVNHARAEWRRFTQRRRRVIRRNPTIARAWESLKELRSTKIMEERAVQRMYDQQCRMIWKYDPDITTARKSLAVLRRRERRLEELINSEVGPPPAVFELSVRQ
jgi:hypothetical protein